MEAQESIRAGLPAPNNIEGPESKDGGAAGDFTMGRSSVDGERSCGFDFAKIDQLIRAHEARDKRRRANKFLDDPYGHVSPELFNNRSKNKIKDPRELYANLIGKRRRRALPNNLTSASPGKRFLPEFSLSDGGARTRIRSNSPAARKREKELENKKNMLPYLQGLYHIENALSLRDVESFIEKYTGTDAKMKKAKISAAVASQPISRIKAIIPPKTTAVNQILLQLLPKPPRSSYPQQEADDLDHQKKLPPPPTQAQATYDVPFLTRRYSTVCEAAGIKPTSIIHVQRRSPGYLLRVIEEVYDAGAVYFKDTRESKVRRILNKIQEKKAATLAEILNVGGVDLQRELKIDVNGGNSKELRDFVKPWIFLPSFFASFIRREYGPQETSHKVLLNFLAELEINRPILLEAEIFSNFLRQLLDETALAFLLHARDLIQTEFGLALKNIKTRALGVEVTGFIRLPGLIMLTKHSTLKEGTMAPFLTEDAVKRIAALVMNDDVQVAQHFINLLTRRGLLRCLPAGSDLMEPTNDQPVMAVEVINFLWVAIEEFVKAPDDVVARVKYNDDGTGMTVLERLQKSLEMDKTIKETQIQLAVMKKEGADQDIEILKVQKKQSAMEREIGLSVKSEVVIELGQVRTALLMKQQKVFKRKADIDETAARLKGLIDGQNQSWTEIMSHTSNLNTNQPNKKRGALPMDPLPPPINPNFFRVARIFELTLRRSLSKSDAEAQVQEKFEQCDWREELSKLQNRSATKIQRWTRRILKVKHEMLRIKQEKERIERLQQEALEAERERERLVQRHKLAEESIVLSRLADMKVQKANYARSVKEHEKKLKLSIAYGIVERMLDAKYKEFKHETLREWRVNAKEIKLKRMTRHRIRQVTFKFWYESAVKYIQECRAARCIQCHWRAKAARLRTHGPLARLRRNNQVQHDHTILRRHRFLLKTVRKWRAYSIVSKAVEQRFQGHQARLKRKMMDNWHQFSRRYKRHVDQCARHIQGLIRMYQGRQTLARLRRERDAATIIQKFGRGYLGRRQVIQERQLIGLGEMAQALGDRVYQRGAWSVWQAAVAIVRMARRNRHRRDVEILQTAMAAWKKIAEGAGSRRLALLHRKEICASKVQAIYRGYSTRRKTRGLFVAWRAAIAIQSGWRGHCCRVRYKIMRHEHDSCVTIQKVWRGHKTRQGLHGFKIQDALLAAKANDYKRLANYFQSYPVLTDEADEEGTNVLHYAAMGGARRTAKLCLKKGLDPNMYNCEGQTALHLCIRSSVQGRDELAAYFVDHGAWIEAPDLEGRTPLLLAAQLGRAVIVHELLGRGANILATDAQGFYALHLATYHRYYAAANELIAAQALEIDALATDGSTALHLAVRTRNFELTELLLDNGAYLEVADANGFTALHIAASLGDEHLASMLLDRGAKIEARDQQGRTPFFVAGMARHNKMLALLSQANADIDAVDSLGDTTLHAVTRDGSLFKTLQMLLSMGANTEIRNNDGDLPTHIAAAKGDQKSMNELVSFGASIRKRNWANLTPVGVARMCAQAPMIEYLSQNFMIKSKADADQEGSTQGEAITVTAPISLIEREEEEEDRQLIAWQEDFEAVHLEWQRVWDEDSQSYYYVHQITGESSWEPPAIDALALIARRDEGLAEAPEIKALVTKTGTDLDNWKKNYLEAREEERIEMEQQLIFDQAAVVITMACHRFLAQCRLNKHRKHRNAARTIQRAVRHFLSTRHAARFRFQTAAAIKLQTVYRGYHTRIHWINRLRPHLATEQKARWLANRLSIIFCGYMARKRYRLMLAKLRGPQVLEDWMTMLKKAGSTLRSYQAMAEYQVPPGYEQEDGKITSFYYDSATNAFAWEQPAVWVAKEIQDAKDIEYMLATQEYRRQDDAARKIANQYRVFKNKTYLGHIIKARQMVKDCEVRYLANQSQFPSLINYSLFNHAINFDYPRAAVLYEKGYKLMKERGPDVHIFLLAYAVLLAASQKAEWKTINEFAERGRKAVGKAILIDKKKTHPFNLAMIGFFRQSTVLRPSSNAWLNLALCHQLIYNDVPAAQKAYVKALDCLDLNPLVLDNYKYFLREYKDTDILFDEAYRSIKQRQDAKIVAEAEAPHLIIMDEQQEEEFNKAATKLQSAWRSYLIRKKIMSGLRWWEDEEPAKHGPAVESTLPNEADPLPSSSIPRWQEYQDETGNPYYYNESSGQYQWDRPEQMQQPSDTALMDITPPAEPTPQTTFVWQSEFDEASGNHYYYNTLTGETRWDRPSSETEQAEGQAGWAITDMPQQQDPAEVSVGDPSVEYSMWQTYVDENSGLPYYYNTITGETRWDPLSAAVQGGSAEEHQTGASDYHETISQSGEEGYDMAGMDQMGIAYAGEGGEGAATTYYVDEAQQEAGASEAASSSSEQQLQIDDQETYYEAAAGEGIDDQPLPEGWAWAFDDEGRIYYYNTITGDLRWDKPT